MKYNNLKIVGGGVKTLPINTISLGQDDVRELAGIEGGKIGLEDLYGAEKFPDPRDCDYYFETIEDFNARCDQIISENNFDLINKTFGFGDKVISLKYSFERKDNIKSTPKMIVGRNITSFERCFNECESLKLISQDLFKHNIKATNFSGCFINCTSLTSIPQNLFKYNTKAIDFSGCFYHCKSLTEIPRNLFKYNTEVIDFNYCFNECYLLTTIPQYLFKYNTEVIYFSGCFDYCYSLTTIPQDLFKYNTKVTYFDVCFNECISLTTVPFDLFDNCKKIEKITECFRNCINITSALPDVWNKDKFPNIIYCNDYAYDCTNAANYNEIPEDFK